MKFELELDKEERIFLENMLRSREKSLHYRSTLTKSSLVQEDIYAMLKLLGNIKYKFRRCVEDNE